jgi:hypothetical protein
MTEPLTPKEVNDLLFPATLSIGGRVIGEPQNIRAVGTCPTYNGVVCHIPLAIGPVRLGPTPEQLAATMPIIEFYDTPWWRRVLNGLFKR